MSIEQAAKDLKKAMKGLGKNACFHKHQPTQYIS